MSSRPRFLMIAFDITDNRRRYRVVRALRDYGERVQKSVFECRLRPLERRALLARLNRLLNPETDRLHVFELPDRDVARIQILGMTPVGLLKSRPLPCDEGTATKWLSAARNKFEPLQLIRALVECLAIT